MIGQLRQRVRNALLAAGVLIIALPAGCGRDERRTPAAKEAVQAGEPIRGGRFAMGRGTLYRVTGEALEKLAVLPGWGEARDTLSGCAALIPGLGETRFRRLTLSPDSAWAAWETVGPGACVGVIGPSEPAVRVLGHWSGAVPDSVVWAPAGRYLAVWLRHAEHRGSLPVFDVIRGERLEMPWEMDCALGKSCDVMRVTWLGGTLLNVEIRLGPAEPPVPFEVNVGTVSASVEPKEEV